MKTRNAHIDGIGSRAGSALFSQWNEIERLRALVLKNGDAETIHDLRVASRRMRATISLLAPFIGSKKTAFIVRAVRRVTRTLGAVRTIDEAIIYFTEHSENVPTLIAALTAVREREFRDVMDSLREFPCTVLDKKLRKAVGQLAKIHESNGQDGIDPVTEHLFSISQRRYQVIHDLMPLAVIPENVELRHALRIGVKKWRYLLETIGLLCRKDYSATLETLKEYQSALGKLNDMAEFGLLCDTLNLPLDEVGEIRGVIGADTAIYLDRFLKLAASRPLKFPDTL